MSHPGNRCVGRRGWRDGPATITVCNLMDWIFVQYSRPVNPAQGVGAGPQTPWNTRKGCGTAPP